MTWQLDSWTAKPVTQQPAYKDTDGLGMVTAKITELPPLVAPGEVAQLKRQLAAAARGESFLLQGGDCAERFKDCRPEVILTKLKILLQMSLVLSYGARKPVVRIGRIAGQFAKPRSSPTEVVDGLELPSYRGDIINGFKAVAETREPAPERLLKSYYHSSITLNYIRSMITGGFAALHHPEHWDLSKMQPGDQIARYHELVGQIRDAISFFDSLGGVKEERLESIDFFTSHEGLLLPYEQALTRFNEDDQRFYDLSAHMLWIGDRTRDLNGAHVEFFSGVANPIGVKLGPTADPKEMVDVICRLNPSGEEGKIVVISRFGADKVKMHLPRYINAFRDAGLRVLWSCDPMHGNTVQTATKIKTRRFQDILAELEGSLEIHQREGSILGGVHFEMTGEDVTECVGGSQGIEDTILPETIKATVTRDSITVRASRLLS